MKITFLTLLLLAFLPLTGISGTQATFDDLFHMDATAAKKLLGEKTFELFQKVLDDFNAVVAGKLPVHAKFHPNPDPNSENTLFIGDGYTVTIIKSPCSIEGDKEDLRGFFYGLMISFQPDKTISGKCPLITHTTFYTSEEFKKLLNETK